MADLKKALKSKPAPQTTPAIEVTLHTPAVQVTSSRIEGHEGEDMSSVVGALESIAKQFNDLGKAMLQSAHMQEKQHQQMLSAISKVASANKETKPPVVKVEAAANPDYYIEMDLDDDGEPQGMFVSAQKQV